VDDVTRIKNLIFRYAELLNTGQFDAVGQLFEHGRIQVKGNPRVYEGAAEVAEMYRSTVNVPAGGPDSLLYTTNVQVSIDGGEAQAMAYFIAYHQRGAALVPVVGGRYEDDFIRLDGEWWFRQRLMKVDLVGNLGEHLHGNIEDYIPGRVTATS
jgi:hypothetical protein